MACTTNCNAATVSRNYIYKSAWDLRHRTGYVGLQGQHGGTHSEQFNSSFHSRLGLAVNGINAQSVAGGMGWIWWIGDIGVKVCKSGCHSSGNAMDFTAIRFSNTGVDMNRDWRSSRPLKKRRQYLGVWAGLRSWNSTVLTNTFNSAHWDHIHVDNGANSSVPPLRTNMGTDTKFVQTASNLLNGTNLAVDGSWGNATWTAFDNLLTKFNIECQSPTTNAWQAHAGILLLRHENSIQRQECWLLHESLLLAVSNECQARPQSQAG